LLIFSYFLGKIHTAPIPANALSNRSASSPTQNSAGEKVGPGPSSREGPANRILAEGKQTRHDIALNVFQVDVPPIKVLKICYLSLLLENI